METLTAAQLTQLGDNFLLFAQAVGNYRYVNRGKLTDNEDKTIKDAHWQLLYYADDFYTASATIIINDVQNSLTTIETITQQINKTYQFLTKIQKALDVAAAGITLASSIFNSDPGTIADAISGLAAAWKSN